jgi:TfoX/Sxy family transcriptional regulator of competence genes
VDPQGDDVNPSRSGLARPGSGDDPDRVKMPKPTDQDKERFRSLVPEAAGVEVKPMFGNLGAFVNGNMFMGLFGADVGLKLPPDAQTELLANEGAGPFGPSERPMGGYVTMPGSWSHADAGPWVERSLAHVAALPPKKAKGTSPAS